MPSESVGQRSQSIGVGFSFRDGSSRTVSGFRIQKAKAMPTPFLQERRAKLWCDVLAGASSTHMGLRFKMLEEGGDAEEWNL